MGAELYVRKGACPYLDILEIPYLFLRAQPLATKIILTQEMLIHEMDNLMDAGLIDEATAAAWSTLAKNHRLPETRKDLYKRVESLPFAPTTSAKSRVNCVVVTNEVLIVPICQLHISLNSTRSTPIIVETLVDLLHLCRSLHEKQILDEEDCAYLVYVAFAQEILHTEDDLLSIKQLHTFALLDTAKQDVRAPISKKGSPHSPN